MVWKHWTRNLGAKLLAVVGACVLWYMATDDLPSTVVRDFPVEYENQPPDITPVSELPRIVEARVAAQGRFLSWRLREGKCRMDLSGMAAGPDKLDFARARLELPEKIDVTDWKILDPDEVEVEFDERITRSIPVSATVVGTPDPRYVQVGKTSFWPTEARVTGARKIVDNIAHIATEPIDISGHKSTVRKRVGLVSPAPPPLNVAPKAVEVGITIEQRIDRKIPEVRLAVAELPAGLTADFRPPSVEVELSGARSVVEVAVEEVVSVALHAAEWAPGTTVLRLSEVRGPELVFGRAAAFPLETAEAENGPGGGEGPEPPVPGEDEVTARLPLPPGIEIVGVKPRNVAVTVANAAVELSDGREEPGGLSP